MAKNDNINIKIEVCKEKNSGKLSIRAHFDSNAPNIAMDKDGYIWIPTFEEKEFINEAFELIPNDNFVSNKQKMQKTQEDFNDKSFSQTPKIDKQKDQPVFRQTDDDVNEKHFEKNVFEKKVNIYNKKYEKEKETPFPYEKENQNNEERVMVEADDAAIEAALKRRINDKAFVEVDEQTIIDKVLSQKRKGKWNNK